MLLCVLFLVYRYPALRITFPLLTPPTLHDPLSNPPLSMRLQQQLEQPIAIEPLASTSIIYHISIRYQRPAPAAGDINIRY
jgi:hypothetical protein